MSDRQRNKKIRDKHRLEQMGDERQMDIHGGSQIHRQIDIHNYKSNMTVDKDQTKQMTCSSNITGHGGAWGWS